MSLISFTDKVRQIFDLRDYLKSSLASVGSTAFDSSVSSDIASKMVAVFGSGGLIMPDFRGEANAFASSYRDFLLDENNLDILSDQAFMHGTRRFPNVMTFINDYFRGTPQSRDNNFDSVSGAIRFMAAEPEPLGIINVLNQMVLPTQRTPSALNSFRVSPNEVCNLKNPQLNLSASMQMQRPAVPEQAAQNMMNSHVQLGKDAIYLVFRHDGPNQVANLELLCDLNNVGNISNLYAANVKVEIVNEIEGRYVPRACVPGTQTVPNLLYPSLRLPIMNGNRALRVDGNVSEQFRMAGGEAALTIPFAVALQPVLAQSYVIVRISGIFLTSGCGVNEIFNPGNYAQRDNIPGFPSLLSERTIFRTGNGCAADAPGQNLDEAFRNIFNRAVRKYKLVADLEIPLFDDISMFNYPRVMETLLRNIPNEQDQNLPLARRLALLKHMYIVSLVLYGLAAFTI